MSFSARSSCTFRSNTAARAVSCAPCRAFANASSLFRSHRHVRNGACGRYRATASARSTTVNCAADRSSVCAFFTSIRPDTRASITVGCSAPDSARTTTSEPSACVTTSSAVT